MDRVRRECRARGIGRAVMLCLGLAFVAACGPAPVASLPTPTPSETPVPTASPTVIWFPPTATHTPFPSPEVTPTQELRGGIGAVLFADQFDDPSAWDLAASLEGRATILGSALTLALTEPRGFGYSLRRGPVLTDFYIEIKVGTSLCQGVDEFGLMLRVTPELDYYRFSLSCDGQTRLDRVLARSAAALQPWISAMAPLGAPGSARLAALVQGDELRLFVNDQHQVTVRDPMIAAGTLGVFVRAAGDTAVTVSFTELVVHRLED